MTSEEDPLANVNAIRNVQMTGVTIRIQIRFESRTTTHPGVGTCWPTKFGKSVLRSFRSLLAASWGHSQACRLHRSPAPLWLELFGEWSTIWTCPGEPHTPASRSQRTKRRTELWQRPLFVFLFSYSYGFVQSDCIIEFVFVKLYLWQNTIAHRVVLQPRLFARQ